MANTNCIWVHGFKNIVGEECIGVERFSSEEEAAAKLEQRRANGFGRDGYVTTIAGFSARVAATMLTAERSRKAFLAGSAT